MTLLLDGLPILILHYQGVLLFLIGAAGLGSGLRGILPSDHDDPPWVSLIESALLGTLILVTYSFLLVVFEQWWTPILTIGCWLILIVAILILVATIYKRTRQATKADFATLGLLAGSFLLLLLMRLAFLKDILLPPYNDSVKHYKIIQAFLHPGTADIAFYSPLNTATHFYHFGFHSLAALIAIIGGMDAAASIMILGEILVTLAPFAVLWLIYTLTENSQTAWAGALFAALVWEMPYFAINWGKYPAVAGLSLAPAVLAFATRYRTEIETRRSYLLLLGLLALTLALLHLRLTICLGLTACLFFLARRLPSNLTSRLSGTVIIWLLGLAVFIPFRDSLTAYYASTGWFGLVVIALFMFFAVQSFSRLSIGIFLFVLGLWLASKVTVPLAGHHLLLLDRPFVDVLLFIPLSLFIGLGFEGLSRSLAPRDVLRWILMIGIAFEILAGIFSAQTFHPDPCCNYVKPADMSALTWIRTNTSPQAVVWVSGYPAGNYIIGTDAGIWVSEIAGRNTNRMAFNLDWSSPNAIATVCKPGYRDVYVYKGGMPSSFDKTALTQQNWLEVAFSANGVVVYRVNCPSSS